MPLRDIVNQTAATPIVDNRGVPTVAFFTLLTQLTELELLRGDGSPEGTIQAKQKTLYFDESGVSGTILYIKTTGPNENTGWVAV